MGGLYRAHSAFEASTRNELSIKVDDLVEIIERHPTGWTFGRLKTETAAGGASKDAHNGGFPDWVIQKRQDAAPQAQSKSKPTARAGDW